MGRHAAPALVLAAAAVLLLWALTRGVAEDRRTAPAPSDRTGVARRATEPVRAPRPVLADGARPEAPSPFASHAPVTLAGRVLRIDGTPLVADQIELRLAGPGGTRQARVRDGFFEVDGLLPGRLELDLVALGHRSLRASVELPIGAGLVNKDFVLQPARWVRLVARAPDGRDLTEALGALGLTARRSAPRFLVTSRELPAPGSSLREQASNTPGRLHPDLLVNEERAESPSATPAGPAFSAQVELNDDAGSGASRTWVGLALGSVLLDARELLPDDETVVLQLDPALLHGRLGGVSLRVLNDADGAPLPHVNAWIGTGDTTALGQSDAAGRIALEGILPGRVMVYLVAAQGPGSLARRAGYAEDLYWVDVAPGDRVDLGDVRLAAPAKLVLTFEADGRPAPPCELEVALLRPTGGTRLFDPFLSRSELVGEVELELPRRELVLVATAPGSDLRSRPSVVDLTDGGTRRGRLVLESATRVELSASSPAAPNWTYLVLDEEGVQAAAGRFDPRGTAHLSLLPGAYWLTVEDSYGFERASLRCDVGRLPLRLAL